MMVNIINKWNKEKSIAIYPEGFYSKSRESPEIVFNQLKCVLAAKHGGVRF